MQSFIYLPFLLPFVLSPRHLNLFLFAFVVHTQVFPFLLVLVSIHTCTPVQLCFVPHCPCSVRCSTPYFLFFLSLLGFTPSCTSNLRLFSSNHLITCVINTKNHARVPLPTLRSLPIILMCTVEPMILKVCLMRYCTLQNGRGAVSEGLLLILISCRNATLRELIFFDDLIILLPCYRVVASEMFASFLIVGYLLS